MAATISNPYTITASQMGSEQQMAMCSILQEAVLSLCQANYPVTSRLEIDAIICISVLSSAEQHVVKIHEKLNDDAEDFYVSENQNDDMFDKQMHIGVTDTRKTVKVRNTGRGKTNNTMPSTYGADTSGNFDHQQSFDQQSRSNRRLSGRIRMENIQKRLSSGSESAQKRQKVDGSYEQGTSREPVTAVSIKIEPQDDDDVTIMENVPQPAQDSSMAALEEPHSTAMYRSDIPTEPPDKSLLVDSKEELQKLQTTQLSAIRMPDPGQFQAVSRTVSSTVTRVPEFHTSTDTGQSVTSPETEMAGIPIKSQSDIRDAVGHLEQSVSNNADQTFAHLQMVQGMDDQYLQSVPSNSEEDIEEVEDGQAIKYEEQTEPTEIRKQIASFHFQDCYFPTEKCSFRETAQCGLPSSQYRTEDLPYCCSLCGKKYRWKTSLHRHVRSHSTYHCTICSKNFDVWEDLVIHKDAKHSRSSKLSLCGICGEGFSTSRKLISHMQSHQMEEACSALRQ